LEDDIERISEIDPITGRVRKRLDKISIFPGSHYVTPESVRWGAIETIRAELKERVATFESENRLIEAQRIRERTNYDLEMIREIGFCKGVENYSRHFSNRKPGAPTTLSPRLFSGMTFSSLSTNRIQTLPQMHAMYNGDRARKTGPH